MVDAIAAKKIISDLQDHASKVLRIPQSTLCKWLKNKRGDDERMWRTSRQDAKAFGTTLSSIRSRRRHGGRSCVFPALEAELKGSIVERQQISCIYHYFITMHV